MDLEVLQAVADVHGTEVARAQRVVELVARPLQGADHDGLLALVHLEGPGTLRLIILCRLKETLVEWGSGKIKLGALCLILNVAEVKVAAEAHTVIACKAIECLIAANLVLGGHFESANWADLAVVLNGVDGGGETIELYSGQQEFRISKVLD